jgi:hypothetical protein
MILWYFIKGVNIMLNLILKDLIIQKKNIAIVLVYAIGAFFFFNYMPYGIFTVMVVAAVYIISQGAFWIDEKNNAEFMLNSLPIDRRTLVKAKYLSIYIYFFAASFIYVLFCLINNTFNMIHLSLDVLRPEVFISGFICVILLSSINYPVYLRFGITKSRYVMFVLFFAIFAGTGVISNVIGGSADSTQSLSSQSNSLLAMAACILAGLAVHYASYRLSYNLYKNKDL